MNKEILDFLEMIGVNTQFLSLWNGFILINNLKFSRFSRRREELFLGRFPDWKVIRSKIFQKMCIRASRVLSKALSPRDKIYINKNDNCVDLVLYLILESYTRKYGVEIICDENMGRANGCGVNSIASSLTLDREVENIVQQMFQGQKIESTILNSRFNGLKVIYPLINIPESWIEAWAQKYDLSCTKSPADGISEDLMVFLEEFIPQVRENILKSAFYVSKNFEKG